MRNRCEEMLEKLHRAKTYKEGQKLLKEEAQKEAQRHRKRMREIRESKILIVSHDNKEEEFEPIPPFLLDMQLIMTSQTILTKAFIDSGADCNVLSYDTWESLGKPTLEKCKMTFKSFSNSQTSCLGKICLKVRIQTKAMHVRTARRLPALPQQRAQRTTRRCKRDGPTHL